MKNGIAAMALVLCSLTQSSAFAEDQSPKTTAGPVVIDIEPEECVTRCFFIRGVPLFCYEVCF